VNVDQKEKRLGAEPFRQISFLTWVNLRIIQGNLIAFPCLEPFLDELNQNPREWALASLPFQSYTCEYHTQLGLKHWFRGWEGKGSVKETKEGLEKKKVFGTQQNGSKAVGKRIASNVSGSR
jgi:hypothetical protein